MGSARIAAVDRAHQRRGALHAMDGLADVAARRGLAVDPFAHRPQHARHRGCARGRRRRRGGGRRGRGGGRRGRGIGQGERPLGARRRTDRSRVPIGRRRGPTRGEAEREEGAHARRDQPAPTGAADARAGPLPLNALPFRGASDWKSAPSLKRRGAEVAHATVTRRSRRTRSRRRLALDATPPGGRSGYLCVLEL